MRIDVGNMYEQASPQSETHRRAENATLGREGLVNVSPSVKPLSFIIAMLHALACMQCIVTATSIKQTAEAEA